MAHSYRELRVWQHAIELVTAIYRYTKSFPRDELYGLTNQMRRAAVSVPSNIAEGQGRLSKKEFHHFLAQAFGSLLELETQIIIAFNLQYLSSVVQDELLEKSGVVKGMLNGLMYAVGSAKKAATTGDQSRRQIEYSRNVKRET